MKNDEINMRYKSPDLTLGVVFDSRLYAADTPSPTTSKDPVK